MSWFRFSIGVVLVAVLAALAHGEPAASIHFDDLFVERGASSSYVIHVDATGVIEPVAGFQWTGEPLPSAIESITDYDVFTSTGVSTTGTYLNESIFRGEPVFGFINGFITENDGAIAILVSDPDHLGLVGSEGLAIRYFFTVAENASYGTNVHDFQEASISYYDEDFLGYRTRFILPENTNAGSFTVVQKGDMDCSGSVDGNDIDAFILAFLSPTSYQANFPDCPATLADVDDNGFLDETDIIDFVAILLSQE